MQKHMRLWRQTIGRYTSNRGSGVAETLITRSKGNCRSAVGRDKAAGIDLQPRP
jgi:hypothetical protein